MDEPGELARSREPGRAELAESLLAEIFKKAGWLVQMPEKDSGWDLLARRKGMKYAVEIKSTSEGRADRLVPLFAQAVLQSARAAGDHSAPLAVVVAPRVPLRVAEQVLEFGAKYAPDAAAGVLDFDGLALFRGPQLDEMNALRAESRVDMRPPAESGHVFTDLNQWLLKVLIAPELSDALLAAPRGHYRNASQLARAANVSVMSAFRFVQQLRREEYLHESAPYLSLVRREDLFRRWQSLSTRSPREVSMRFVLPGNPEVQIGRMLASGRACLALFAAAHALQLGFVDGVPPYVYVQRIGAANLAAWKNLRQCEPGELPDVIVRQAPAPQSVFRGLVRPGGQAACDVMQIWLDIASHPSRGREQAELIQRRVLGKVLEESQ